MFHTLSFLVFLSSFFALLAACDGPIAGAGSAICGDGVLDIGEQCDDGNTSPNDGCAANCSFENLNTRPCGNGNLDSGEECDDGNLSPGDGCDSNCRVEVVCGNGTVDTGEECDDGNRTAGDGCDAECKTEGSVCGNGEIEEGEQCDDSNVLNYDGCSEFCLDERCGDNILQPGEECDDGNTDSRDGCSEVCEIDAGTCEAQFQAFCDTQDTWSTLAFGSTDNVDGYSCNEFDETGREYAYLFAPVEDTTMTVTLSPAAGVDLDLFLLSDHGDGVCKGSECSLYADNSITALFPGGGQYWIVVDGYQGAEGDYTIDFDCEGDPLQCPDGTGNNGDSCADVYQGSDIWRCTVSSALNNATVSQVCRDSGYGPVWLTFHIDPTECCSCAGDFDVGCCAANSGSTGCP